ncbi:MAG: hypothetical protein ACKPB8_13865, partial [Alphaproteobacteria bacterium]
VLDTRRIARMNAVDESLTIATLPNFTPVNTKEMVATIKVIPFAVPGQMLGVVEAVAKSGAGPVLAIHPFRALKVGLVLSELPGIKESIMEGAVEATEERIAGLCGTLLPVERVRHDTVAISDALSRLRRAGAEMLLVAGASAVVDRRDVGPAAIVRAGGVINHFGMPVDPGNLLCLGHIGKIPAMVLPGCARSPTLNGFDWVLQRLFAGLEVTPEDIGAMGVGGLLKEIELRPLPRDQAPRTPPPALAPRRGRRVAAIVLAAGRSRRPRSRKPTPPNPYALWWRFRRAVLRILPRGCWQVICPRRWGSPLWWITAAGRAATSATILLPRPRRMVTRCW